MAGGYLPRDDQTAWTVDQQRQPWPGPVIRTPPTAVEGKMYRRRRIEPVEIMFHAYGAPQVAPGHEVGHLEVICPDPCELPAQRFQARQQSVGCAVLKQAHMLAEGPRIVAQGKVIAGGRKAQVGVFGVVSERESTGAGECAEPFVAAPLDLIVSLSGNFSFGHLFGKKQAGTSAPWRT
jgi:hypothetical protein